MVLYLIHTLCVLANAQSDDANGTHFEHDLNANQLRHGGDVQGFVDSLDYLQGMGIKGIYLAGSAFINLPWEYDGEDETARHVEVCSC